MAGHISAYEEVKQLGKGAFGTVFLVRERSTRRPWVMKRVALKGMQPRERQSAFQEARLLQRLRQLLDAAQLLFERVQLHALRRQLIERRLQLRLNVNHRVVARGALELDGVVPCAHLLLER